MSISQKQAIIKMYEDAQANCGIKKGDWVRVIDKCNQDFYWAACMGWVDEMDAAVGKVFRVLNIEDGCMELQIQGNNKYFPYFCLKKIDYATAQAESGLDLKSGDKVLVKRGLKDGESWMGSHDDYVWLSRFNDPLVGKTCIVSSLGRYGVNVYYENKLYILPFFILEKVKSSENTQDYKFNFYPANDKIIPPISIDNTEQKPKQEALVSPNNTKRNDNQPQQYTFTKGQKVLVRDNNSELWYIAYFIDYKPEMFYPYYTEKSVWKQCIPYDGNEHLEHTDKNPLSNGLIYPKCVLEKALKPEHEFKPFDKILVRHSNTEEWIPKFFACYRHYSTCKDDVKCFTTTDQITYEYGIPYEGNEHLAFTKTSPVIQNG